MTFMTMELLLVCVLPGAPQERGDPLEGLWKPVTLELKDVSAAHALKRIFDASGEALKIPDGASDKQVALRLDGATFWQAIDEVCRLHGAIRHVDSPFSHPCELRSGKWIPYPVFYRGPLRMYIHDSAQVREFRYPGRADRTEVALVLQWTPGVSPALDSFQRAGWINLWKAEDDTGKSLLPEIILDRNYDHSPGGGLGVTATAWLLRLQPVGKGARSIVKIEGEWVGAFLSEFESLTIEKPGENIGVERRIGPIKVTVAGFQSRPGDIAGFRSATFQISLSLDRERASQEFMKSLAHVTLGPRVHSEILAGPDNRKVGFFYAVKPSGDEAARLWGSVRDAAVEKSLTIRVATKITKIRVPFSFHDILLPEEGR